MSRTYKNEFRIAITLKLNWIPNCIIEKSELEHLQFITLYDISSQQLHPHNISDNFFMYL